MAIIKTITPAMKASIADTVAGIISLVVLPVVLPVVRTVKSKKMTMVIDKMYNKMTPSAQIMFVMLVKM